MRETLVGPLMQYVCSTRHQESIDETSSIAPVKYLIRRVDLKDVKFVIDQSRNEGHESVRTSVINWVKKNT